MVKHLVKHRSNFTFHLIQALARRYVGKTTKIPIETIRHSPNNSQTNPLGSVSSSSYQASWYISILLCNTSSLQLSGNYMYHLLQRPASFRLVY